MFDLERQTITLGGKSELICRYEVWFQIPLVGLCSTHEEAIAKCKEMDFEPQLVMTPVPVAVGPSMHEILLK